MCILTYRPSIAVVQALLLAQTWISRVNSLFLRHPLGEIRSGSGRTTSSDFIKANEAFAVNEHSGIRRKSTCYAQVSNDGVSTTKRSATASTATQPRVVIVGGGVGGLAIASRIASSLPACNVTILEKNERVGGRCGSFTVDVPGYDGAFRHERGPSLLLLPHVYRELFQDCCPNGSPTASDDYALQIVPCVPAYQAIFSDGDCIEVGFRRGSGDATSELSAAELESRRKMDEIEPHGSSRWDEYMRACEAFLNCGLPNFIEERLDLVSFPAFLREALRDFGRFWPLKPHSDVLDANFLSNKLRALASFQDLYVGLEPYRNDAKLAGGIFETTAPSVFGLLAAIELHPNNEKCGVFAPIGGFQQVTEKIEQLARDLGVHFVCGKTATKVTGDGVIYCDTLGTATESQFIEADLVVVNADLPFASKVLLEENGFNDITRFDWEDNYKFSSGVIAFHWSLNQVLQELNTHNVFLASSSRAEAVRSWKVLRQEAGRDSLDAINFYVHRPGKVDSSAAPKVFADIAYGSLQETEVAASSSKLT